MSTNTGIRLYGVLARTPIIGAIIRYPVLLLRRFIGQEIERTLQESHGIKVDSMNQIRERLEICETSLQGIKRSVSMTTLASSEDAPGSSIQRFWPATQASTPASLECGLERYGRKIHSQNDEDGIIEYINARIGISNGYFVEFGVGPADGQSIEEGGLECNCRLLLEKGWQGLLMDGRVYPEEFQVRNERITALNINTLLNKYNVPLEFELLSIDVDGQDFWIWMATQYFPKVVIVEYNPSLHIDESRVMPLDVSYVWDGTQYYGASLLALHKLAADKGYTLVYANGVNAFFVRSDLLSNAGDFKYEDVYNYRGRLLYHRADHLNRSYLRV